MTRRHWRYRRDIIFSPVSKKAQIVLVEDNPDDVILVREALHSRGLQVDLSVIETDGQAEEFLSALANKDDPCPVLVLLDLNLPELHSKHFLRQLRMHRPVPTLTL